MATEVLLTTAEAAAAQQPATSAAVVGNSGFDYKTAADFLSGKTVTVEAMRNFVAASRWAHDDRAGLQATLLSVRGELASREAEIALLKKALMDAEAPQADSQSAPVPTRAFLERTLAAMEGVIDVADRQTDEFEALRSCVIDLTVLLFSKSAPARDYPPLPMQFACSGVFPVYSADQMRAYVDADRAARARQTV